MGTARINITLPEEILAEVSSSVEPRKRSRFIADAITRAIKELKAQRLAAEYAEAAQEISRVNSDLEGTVGDGLD